MKSFRMSCCLHSFLQAKFYHDFVAIQGAQCITEPEMQQKLSSSTAPAQAREMFLPSCKILTIILSSEVRKLSKKGLEYQKVVHD